MGNVSGSIKSRWASFVHWLRWGATQRKADLDGWKSVLERDPYLSALVRAGESNDPTTMVGALLPSDDRRGRGRDAVRLSEAQLNQLDLLATVQGTSTDDLVQTIVQQALDARMVLLRVAQGKPPVAITPAKLRLAPTERSDFYFETLVSRHTA
ncbi:MAG: hypothetical protein JWM34_1006 [Ilumatobacteraceae bacterium]|nr:hypothetical protein [Ilumatobacteraceae bacterium]